MKRSGPFREPPDSQNYNFLALIPFPNLGSYNTPLANPLVAERAFRASDYYDVSGAQEMTRICRHSQWAA